MATAGVALGAVIVLAGCSSGGELGRPVELFPSSASISADEHAVSTEQADDALTETTLRNAVDLLEGLGDVPTVLELGEQFSLESTACLDGESHQARLWTTPRAGGGTPVLETPFLGDGLLRVARLRVPSAWDPSDGAVLEISCERNGERGWSEFSIALRRPA